jgi:DNA-directed RNA polymerase specialized sigma24 family protein
MKAAGSFDALLAVLGPTPDQSAAAYRQLHARLTRFFALNNAADPADLADRTLDRLARSLESREIASPVAFALGIARLLLKEEARARAKEIDAARDWTAVTDPASDLAEKEDLLARLDRCLDRMPPERREMLRAYYGWAGSTRIEHHRLLAGRLGVSVHALRNRLLRARADLSICMERGRHDVSALSSTSIRVQQRSREGP